MNYQSTRNAALTASSAEAILNGLAPDGGLYAMPALAGLDFDWQRCLTLSTQGMATEILCALLPDFTHAEMEQLVHAAYTGKFETEDLTPTVPVGEDTVLELFRGPTSAFKDVALSMLPHLMTAAKKKCGVDDEILILTATSGDTGKAAMEGFCDVVGTKIIVFYPDGGVSAVQKAQMVTQGGDNTCVAAVRGNFDDAQTGVKDIFADAALASELDRAGVVLSSANSINWGRLAPQIAYYFAAYAQLLRAGAVAPGERVDFSVPTGNFGDILAGYFAKRSGLPVGKLLCASNSNNVLTDFLRTGVYDKNRPFLRTMSPSMDILVSSNLERLLYLAAQDGERVSEWMRALRGEGKYAVGEELLRLLADEGFAAFFASEEETARVLKNGGFFFVAGPGPRHLSGLKKALYDTPYDNPEKHREYKGFRKIDEITCDYTVTVHGGAIRDLFAMTPYYWKTSKSDGEKLQGLERLETELSFRIGVYRKA